MSPEFPSPPNRPQEPQQPEKQPIAILPMQEEISVPAIGGQNIDNYSLYFAQKYGEAMADSLAKYGGYGAIRIIGEWNRIDKKEIRIELTDEEILNYFNGKLNVANRVKEIAFSTK